MNNKKFLDVDYNKIRADKSTHDKYLYTRLIQHTCSDLQRKYSMVCRTDLYDFVMDAIVLSLKDNNLKFRSYYQLKTWIYTTARNGLINSFKQRRRLLYADFDGLIVGENDNYYIYNLSSNYGHFQDIENRLTVNSLKNEATHEELEIIEKYYYLGWKFEEVAKYMNCGISCIKARNFRMLVKFRKIMGITSHLHKKCKNK
jgi:RNA polymerase sigma factor (sigma-70 family)